MYPKHFNVGLLAAVAVILTLAPAPALGQGVITTIAGNGSITSTGDGGLATNAGIGFPLGVAVDSTGNVYIAYGLYNCERKVNKAGLITTVAGNGFPLFSGED